MKHLWILEMEGEDGIAGFFSNPDDLMIAAKEKAGDIWNITVLDVSGDIPLDISTDFEVEIQGMMEEVMGS